MANDIGECFQELETSRMNSVCGANPHEKSGSKIDLLRQLSDQ